MKNKQSKEKQEEGHMCACGSGNKSEQCCGTGCCSH